jgi:phage terminase small subunit
MDEKKEAGGGVAYNSGMMMRDPRSGSFVAVDGLTEQQAEYVKEMVRNGGNERNAALAAGYSENALRSACYSLRRNPRVVEALRRERENWIQTTGGSLAVKTLEALMRDPATSGQVKLQAAKFTLEAAGHGLQAQKLKLGLPDPDKPLAEMSLIELEAFLKAGSSAIATLQEQKAKTIDITPEKSE